MLVNRPSEATGDIQRRYACFRCAVNFHPIASRQHQRLHAAGMAQHTIRFGVSGETFAHLDVSIVMAQADAENIHGVCIWAVKVIPQRRVSAALNPTMQSAATRFGVNRRRCRPCKIAP